MLTTENAIKMARDAGFLENDICYVPSRITILANLAYAKGVETGINLSANKDIRNDEDMWAMMFADWFSQDDKK